MKKEYLIFDAYIKTVSKEIKDRKVKRELKEELFSHLIEIYERNIALGMSDEEAQKNAVAHMGDSESVAETFKKLYPISTNKFLKQLTGLLVYAFVHYFITLWSDGYLLDIHNIRIFIAFTAQFIVFYCLRRANKYFKVALITTVVNYLFIFVFSILNKHLILDFEIFLAVVNFIFDSIKYIFFFMGIKKIEKDAEISKDEFLSSRISAMLMITTHAILVASSYIYSELFMLIFIIAFFTAIYPIIHIGSSYDLLDRIEWDIKKAIRDKRIAVIIVGVFYLIAIVINLIPTSAPELKDFQPVSMSINEKANKVRENLISLGLPQNIAFDLPDNEILLYDNAEKMETDNQQSDYVTLRKNSYAFFICDDTEALDYVRILVCLDDFDNFESFYRDGIYVYLPDNNEFDYFTQIICESNNEAKVIIPSYSNMTNTEKAIGCEFRLPEESKNERLYFSASVDITSDVSFLNFWCSYYHGEKFDNYRTFQAADIHQRRSSQVLSSETIRCEFDNPMYIEPEEPSTIAPPFLNDEVTTEEIEDFDNIDDLIEYWNP